MHVKMTESRAHKKRCIMQKDALKFAHTSRDSQAVTK